MGRSFANELVLNPVRAGRAAMDGSLGKELVRELRMFSRWSVRGGL